MVLQACIIGAETNGLLYIGVRNKYCYMCNSNKKNQTEKKHKCYKNHKGSSTSMEQEILVQGFQASESMHGLRYKFIISDGDSSALAKIQQFVSYGRYVVKLECANHMVRNYTAKLHKITKDTTHDITHRKELTQLIPRLTNGARAAIKEAGENRHNSDVLRRDLINGPLHVFGEHKNCRNTFCNRKDDTNKVPIMSLTSVWSAVMKALDPLISKADKLIGNHTTNQAERYMSLVSKFSGGKRTDVGKSGRYKRCCLAAGLSHIKGPAWHLSPAKRMFGHSPGNVPKKVLCARKKTVEQTRKRPAARHLSFGRAVKRKRVDAGPDQDYGPEATRPDISHKELETKKKDIMVKLEYEVSTKELCEELERKTVGQHCNNDWKTARMNRLTASSFAKICKMKETTSCHSTVVSIINPKDLNTEAIKYGRVNEAKAIDIFQEKFNERVMPCGLFVRPEYPFLGASPDGLVGDDTVVEVKCLPSINIPLENKTTTSMREACRKKKIATTVNSDGSMQLNKSHAFFYQIQGQLNISQRNKCMLILYCDFGTEFISVERDENFWLTHMVPKLSRFFYECVLPELADSRHARGLRCRDSLYIKNAQNEKKNSNKNKIK